MALRVITALEPNLENADWIVFAFSEFRMNSEESIAFQELFSSKAGDCS